jgi:hypothetical protein
LLIVSTWTGCADEYRRLAHVLDHSARRHNPDAQVRVINTDPSPTSRSTDGFLRKARDWTAAIDAAQDGTELALLDTDTLVLGSLAPAWEADFDVAITTRGGLATLNSGVLFVRVSRWTRELFAPWERLTRPWCEKNRPGCVRYGDQDALMLMLRLAAVGNERLGGMPRVRVLELPCAIWNAQQHCWPPVEGCKLLHVKSDARRIIFGGKLHGNPGADVVADLWRAEELTAARNSG